MAILNFLRMMVDLSFYGAFAGLVCAYFGGGSMFGGLFFLSLCFGISAKFKSEKIRRFFIVISAASGLAVLYLWPNEAQVIDGSVFLPAAAYVVCMVWRDNYELSWYRQVDIFSVFWKVFLAFAVLMSMVGLYRTVLVVSVPMVLLTLFSSVILMRTLRHEPEVYLQKEYQVRNLVSLGLLAAASGLLSTKAVTEGVSFLWKAFYNFIAAPIMLVAASGVGYMIMGIFQVLKWIFFNAGMQTDYIEEMIEGLADNGDSLWQQEQFLSGHVVIWQLLLVVFAIVLIAIFVCFFRWISRKQEVNPGSVAFGEKRVGYNTPETQQPGESFNSAVYQVRRQYRKFLKLYVGKGGKLRHSDTSLDVEARVCKVFCNREAARELRSIYVKARYHHKAGREDVQRAKELYGILRKE